MKKSQSFHTNSNRFSLVCLAILAGLGWSNLSNAGVLANEMPSTTNDQTLDVTLTGQLESGNMGDRYGWIAKTGWVWTGNIGTYGRVPNIKTFKATYGYDSDFPINGSPTLIAGLLANNDLTMEGSVQLDITQYTQLPDSIFYGVLGYTDGFINDSYDSNQNSPSGHINNQTFTIDGSLTINVDDGATLSSLYGISTGHPGTETGIVNTLNIGGDVSINYTSSSDTTAVSTNVIGAEVLQGGGH